VSVATMAKLKSDQTPEAESGSKEEETTLKVAKPDAELVGLVASHRKVSVKNLFKMQDVNDFFTHLLLEEMRREAERLKKKR
jgi:hypothetical protein